MADLIPADTPLKVGKMLINEKIAELDTQGQQTQAQLDEGLGDVNAKLIDITTINNHTVSYSYYSDGSVQTVTEKNGAGIVVKTVTYNYNPATGDVSTSVTVMNGKTVTTTYNYDSNRNITSTTNVIT